MALDARNTTVRQAVQPSSSYVPINVTVNPAGTAKDIIVFGQGETIGEVIREFDFIVTLDCYIAFGHDATSADIPLLANDSFSKKNMWITRPDGTLTSKLSIINANAGEKPNIRGMVGGY